MSAANLDGASLEKALAEHKFEKAPAKLVGMAKASATPGHISFARSGCESWVDIPAAMIAEAEYIGNQPCKDHSHPVFRLSLKEPADPQSKVLMALLAAGTAPVPSFAAPPNMGGLAGTAPQTGQAVAQARAQCQTFCSGSTLWCMCPVYIPGVGQGYSVYPCGSCINDPIWTAIGSVVGLSQNIF